MTNLRAAAVASLSGELPLSAQTGRGGAISDDLDRRARAYFWRAYLCVIALGIAGAVWGWM